MGDYSLLICSGVIRFVRGAMMMRVKYGLETIYSEAPYCCRNSSSKMPKEI